MNRPCVIGTWRFGKPAVEKAGELLSEGMNILDAVEEGINVTEEDPEVDSVGYGGKPNSEGIVELDAAIMEGNSFRVGSVAGLRGFRRPISVARAVIESGLFADGEVGAAAATGDGDEILKYCISFLVVELMRNGAAPEKACSLCLERYKKKNPGLAKKDLSVIAINMDGEFAAATLREIFPFAVWTPGMCGLHEVKGI